MSDTEMSPRGVVAATQRAILAGDVDGFAGLFAEDAVLEFPFAREPHLPSRVEGRGSIRAAAAALGERLRRAGAPLSGFENLVVHETTDPEVLVVEFEALGGSPGGEGAYRLPDIQVWRIRGGRVLSMRDYLGAPARAAVLRPMELRVTGGSAWG